MDQHFNPDRLEALRLAHHLTKSDFAKRIGATRQNLHNWMCGRNKPTVSNIERAAKAFGLDSRYFFEDTDHQIGRHTANSV